MSEIIKVEHLRYVYNPGMPDETAALDDVSFSIEKGDFVGVMGSTGSGKSTLIAHFNGLNRPTSGKIIIDGRDMWAEGENLRDFRFLVGLVMQYPEYQLFEETCWKDIAYGPRNMGLDEEESPAASSARQSLLAWMKRCCKKARLNFPAGKSAALPLRALWPWSPRSWCWTNPQQALTPKAAIPS